MALSFWSQLDRIERKLDAVLRMERMDMADERALDEAIAELSTAVDGLVAKAAEADIDLTDEVSAIQAITSRIGDALHPAEPPVDTPPPTEEPA